jgi:mannose-6-phosphate isomerase-like protein (cupin superfamily)
MEKVNLAEKFALFSDHWSPTIVGEINHSYVKLARLKGEFIGHNHRNEDEMFLVVSGNLTLRFRDGEIALRPGEFLIVPRGVEHLPGADEEVCVMLLEPRSTLNTGNVDNERTVSDLRRICRAPTSIRGPR